jgi:pimeloyl-ACP methyl ester carboxylesterase
MKAITALDAALRCRDTYNGPTPGATRLEAAGFVADVFPLERGTLIVPRGSDNPINWIADCDARKVAHPWGAIHEGFGFAWSALRELLEPYAQGAIIWAGHSLGGAIATLGAAEWPFSTSQVLTFGCPRVANGAFGQRYAALLSTVTERYHYRLDPVPFLPPAEMGFAHVVPAEWYDGKKWHEAFQSYELLTQLGHAGHLLADHHIDNYIAALSPAPSVQAPAQLA